MRTRGSARWPWKRWRRRVRPGGRAGAGSSGLETWLREGDARLAAVCAAALPNVTGAAALGPLRETATDGDRPAEVRIAALRSLGEDGNAGRCRHVARGGGGCGPAGPSGGAGGRGRAGAVPRTRTPADAARDLLIEALRGRLRTGESSRGYGHERGRSPVRARRAARRSPSPPAAASCGRRPGRRRCRRCRRRGR